MRISTSHLIFAGLITLIATSQAATVKPNGGYDLVVTVTGGASAFTGGILDTIKNNLNQLSTKMWMATDETFFIETVKILVPPGLTSVEDISNEYEEGDIRISPEVTYPNVDNPNLCGQAGNFIQLPLSFFSNANSGKYGDNAKALLVQWARYRWGAWEEHGYPGDEKFPFFYRANVTEEVQEWRATGCNNAPNNELVGEYRNVNDGTPCNEKDEADLDKNCRFFPDIQANQGVTSSLMHFHYLDSVVKFCDETNHQSETPNRQNLFCQGKSVMETIRTSEDYLKVNETVSQVPIIKFQVQRSLQATNRPALYVLLDHGSIDEASAAPLITLVVPQLPRLIDQIGVKNVIAAVGTFAATEDNTNVTEVVSWKPIAGNENEFIDKIGYFPLGGAQNRDFLMAIDQARQSIEEVSPQNGGIIVLLKTGPGIDFSKAPYEAIYANSLVEKNIRLFAIEIPTVNETRSKLVNVAQYTGGASVLFGSQAEAGNLDQLITDALTSFQDDEPSGFSSQNSIMANKATVQRIRYSENVNSGVEVKVPVSPGAEWVNLYFYTAENLELTAISAQIDATQVFEFTKTREWGEADDVDVGKRYAISGQLNVTRNTEQQNVTFKFTSPAQKSGYLVVAVQGTELEESFDIEISTTAVDGVLDFEGKEDDLTPFVVTAKVFYMGTVPVPGLSVIATAVFTADGTSTSVHLRDNGDGKPDVALNDGLYTGTLIPAQDGVFELSVSITPGEETDSEREVEEAGKIVLNSRAGILMLPVDQEDIGCGLANCDETVVEPPKGLTKTVKLEGEIEVKNRAAYKKEPIEAIKDLKATQGENNDDFILTFTAPSLVGEIGAPSRYDVYSSTDESALTTIDTSDPTKPLPSGVTYEQNSTVSSQTRPGSMIDLAQKSNRDATRHFVIVARNGVNHSPISNLATVGEISEDSKPWLETTGGIITIVAIVVIIFAGAVAGGWYMKKRRAAKAKSNESV